SLSPSPVMVLTPVLGEAGMASWPRWRRMGMVFEPIRPVPPMTTIFMAYPPFDAWSRFDTVGTCCPYSPSWRARERAERASRTGILRRNGREITMHEKMWAAAVVAIATTWSTAGATSIVTPALSGVAEVGYSCNVVNVSDARTTVSVRIARQDGPGDVWPPT